VAGTQGLITILANKILTTAAILVLRYAQDTVFGLSGTNYALAGVSWHHF
jgi:hypothetical protein